jgi:hypothetical protein
MAREEAGEANGMRRHAIEVVALAVAASILPLAGWLFWAFVLHRGSNDFHDYWLAGRLLLEGRSPYDAHALAELASREHLSFMLGGGYSYPLPYALAMVPFALLPFDWALVAFNSVSLVAFGLTVGAWLVAIHGAPGLGSDPCRGLGRRRFVVALAAGAYPPVYGTVVMGQANLVLFPLLAAGAALAVSGSTSARRAGGGALLGLAAIVKLVPGALVVPLTLGRRWGGAAGLVAGGAAAFALAVAAAPWAAAGSGSLGSLMEPDTFYTNQSINGFVTRLAWEGDRTLPIWRGAFDPRVAMLALTAAFGAATLGVLWWRRAALRGRRGAMLGLGFALVAATIGAPKTSFWNESLVLAAVALLLAAEAPGLTLRAFGALDRALLAVWFGGAVLWAAVWAVEPARTGPLSWAVTLLWSSSLFSLLALWSLFVRRLAGLPAAREPLAEPASSAQAV